MRYFNAMIAIRLVLLLLCICCGTARAQPPAPLPPGTLNLIGQAEQALAQNNDRQAESLISQVPPGSLDASQLARTQILRAEIALRRQQPEAALRALPPGSQHVPAFASRIELLRARAAFMAGDAVGAVRTLVNRERALSAPQAIADNRERIWNGLVTTPLPDAALLNLGGEDAVTRGWLELARVLQQGARAPALAAWIDQFPSHPARAKAALVRPGAVAVLPPTAAPIPPASAPPAMPAPEPFAAAAPEAASATPLPTTGLAGGYALLLPLTGPLASAGTAVREGFISAWFDGAEPRPPLRIYDTGQTAAQTLAALHAALRDGASFIVGPLSKESVDALVSQGVNLPWLTLNYLDNSLGGAAQFGLAPEDEARAAARSAAAAGQRQALALVPDGDWGSRALQAFQEEFNVQGGRVLQVARYRKGAQDFGPPLRQLLHLERSTQRHKELTAVLGVPSEFEPRPRADADALFLPLRAGEAKVLVPQLAFFRARRLVTYTLSAAHGGTPGPELDGLSLCDMPWVLDRQGPWVAARERAAVQFPDVLAAQPRLFALGADAFRLAQALARGDLIGGRELAGASGRLQLAADGRVRRAVDCRPMRDGRPAAS